MTRCDDVYAYHTDDIQNQTAARLARDVDPEGKRTIGVLTKVDRVQGQADTNDWMKVIQGQKHQLAHGYYVSSGVTTWLIHSGHPPTRF